MLPQGSSRLRRTIAVLILSVSAAPSAYAQAPAQPPAQSPAQTRAQSPAQANPEGGGPIVPESLAPRDTSTTPTGGLSTNQPVLTPGYFEVVCPAICYGGAFRVCNIKAFAGPGYYGPFRRYWAYGTYGPSFNIGPDNSLQYGLISGVMYVVERHGHGCYKHGTDCACHCAHCTKGGSLASLYGQVGQVSFLRGASQQPAQNSSQPTPNSDGQPPEKLPPPTGNSAHLRIRVPKNAEVLVEGSKTTTTGTLREFVSPPLAPGKNMIYSILVRYTDAGGKKIEEAHSIRVHANDQLDIDCTKPANAEPPRATVRRP